MSILTNLMVSMQKYHSDESTDLSTTYLGKSDMTRDQIIKAEEKIPNFWTRVYKWQVTRQYRM